jgi:23S rRNA pseudouridine955/2504/2580 synthase/23S rRNA pseudouridine1911/1915/1917 synthase
MMENRILIEDEHLIGVKKHAGELVVADRWGIEKRVLLHSLGEYLRAKGHQPDASGRDLYPVHRLDRETSGVVLFAKHEEAHRLLSKMFESREMKKTYWAFTAGVPEWDHCLCSIPLSRAEGKKGRGRALIDLKHGKPSETDFRVKDRFGDIGWIEAKPHTGRLHQIRIHLKSLGVPILWDHTYWNEAWKSHAHPDLPPQTLPLHARTLEFSHPFGGKPVLIECPMEEEMRNLLNRLKESSEKRRFSTRD